MTNKKLVFVFESVNIKSGAGSGEMEPKKKSVEWMAFELSRIVSRQSRSCSSAKAIVHEAIAGLKECATGSGQSTVLLEAILRGEEGGGGGNFGRPKKKIGIAVGSQGVRVGSAFALQLASFAEFVELRGGMEQIEPETIEDKLGLLCALTVIIRRFTSSRWNKVFNFSKQFIAKRTHYCCARFRTCRTLVGRLFFFLSASGTPVPRNEK